jgi:hypothetical protein
MSTLTGALSNEKGTWAFVKSHPLISYFFLAYAGMWIIISPLVLDGLGMINLSDGASLLFFFLSLLSGPTVAAYVVTGLLEGKAGMLRLFRRTFQVRAGWRGFALPHLQAAYGPVVGTIILGTLHGIWDLPALFTPLLGPFTVERFIVFVLTAAAGTFIYTWVFNNTRGSVWMAMVLHASSNAASQ